MMKNKNTIRSTIPLSKQNGKKFELTLKNVYKKYARETECISFSKQVVIQLSKSKL